MSSRFRPVSYRAVKKPVDFPMFSPEKEKQAEVDELYEQMIRRGIVAEEKECK